MRVDKKVFAGLENGEAEMNEEEVELLTGFLHFHLQKIVYRRIACFMFEQVGEPGNGIIVFRTEIIQ